MKFDLFFSICQNEISGFKPTERKMFENFFDQVKWADELGYEVAWLAETHLSCQVQKRNSEAVIPHFRGEIGLNTDILQMAHLIFRHTKKIEVGSAIRNILCNGGPIAHAEALKTFLTLHDLEKERERRLHFGFASGRFAFSNIPYGIFPRDALEKAAWPVVKGKVFQEASEIFLRFLNGEIFSSQQVSPQFLKRSDFRSEEEWQKILEILPQENKNNIEKDQIPLKPRYFFDQVGVIPFEAPLDSLQLLLGSHDPLLQTRVNEIRPVAIFNLSITPPSVIEETHRRMEQIYHKKGGPWRRDYMPRTAMIFIDETKGWSKEAQTQKAQEKAKCAWEVYWQAMEGTIDIQKVEQAVSHTLAGSPTDVANQIRTKYHPQDRLMLWFDFNNHNNEEIKNSMRLFMEKVRPLLPS